MDITKDLFMKLANKFFADPDKGRVLQNTESKLHIQSGLFRSLIDYLKRRFAFIIRQL